MKTVKNQYKIWDKTNKTFVSVSHGKSSWATLTGAENKLKDMCAPQNTHVYWYNNYNTIVRKTNEFEIRMYELVCSETRTYTLDNKLKLHTNEITQNVQIS